MIREQIAKELWGIYSEDEPEIGEDFYEQADSILSLLCAEIEKMGLSDEEQITLDNRFRVETDHRLIIRQVAQAQLQKILKELKEGAE